MKTFLIKSVNVGNGKKHSHIVIANTQDDAEEYLLDATNNLQIYSVDMCGEGFVALVDETL